ncbi:hypothetical protein B0T16DRAFT_453209 [Cercophora newfieldiana]|uniref:Uncharacterized protein n=1 Tax=Cercophora newfieldiana TaxID=92897 RepID=A0AA39YUD8_9PEZI|nr:hypothetical protein B0T16DRAFT_453209 [Cercophora newfieldiana]
MDTSKSPTVSRPSSILAGLLLAIIVTLFAISETNSTSATNTTGYGSSLWDEASKSAYLALMILVSPIALHTVVFMYLFSAVVNGAFTLINGVLENIVTIIALVMMMVGLFLVVTAHEPKQMPKGSMKPKKGKDLPGGGSFAKDEEALDAALDSDTDTDVSVADLEVKRAAPKKSTVNSKPKHNDPMLDKVTRKLEKAFLNPDLAREAYEFAVLNGYEYLFELPEDDEQEEKGENEDRNEKEKAEEPRKAPEEEFDPKQAEEALNRAIAGLPLTGKHLTPPTSPKKSNPPSESKHNEEAATPKSQASTNSSEVDRLLSQLRAGIRRFREEADRPRPPPENLNTTCSRCSSNSPDSQSSWESLISLSPEERIQAEELREQLHRVLRNAKYSGYYSEERQTGPEKDVRTPPGTQGVSEAVSGLGSEEWKLRCAEEALESQAGSELGLGPGEWEFRHDDEQSQWLSSQESDQGGSNSGEVNPEGDAEDSVDPDCDSGEETTPSERARLIRAMNDQLGETY